MKGGKSECRHRLEGSEGSFLSIEEKKSVKREIMMVRLKEEIKRRMVGMD